ncbi:hybrid sensor histidine kinase/response regulator [Desulfatitalea alkaliphila]|uniref:histidine kinase n=1 Tax=Desulfatitalea alkaliphila TaxID=2929485 RepID=A0AA41R3C4_9BACT|nr:response regulator [Desulfatitalea alkaliphila]MCJ8500150.1 response regulator [Desulfatitalea alkaliphila]
MSGDGDRNIIRVLLVDDEEDYRSVLHKRLSGRSISVVEAATGQAALDQLSVAPVDVVVMDVKMPGMDGVQTLKCIKDRYPELEVILLTGHANPQDGVEGIKMGAFDYLSKPIEIEQLVRKIRQADEKIVRARVEKEEAAFRERIKQQMVIAERLAALGTMATGVAHEINNPLAIIQESAGWLQQILGKPELRDIPRKADFEKALNRIGKAVHRARNITRQLLQAVHTQSTDLTEPVEMVAVDLQSLARESISLVEQEAQQKQIAIRLDIVEPLPVVWSEPYPLLQVLINLMTNAIHATGAGGTITLRLEGTDDRARITVLDTGCGISEEHLPRIFEPFFTTKGVGQGTGMGLYVSWGIIQKLGGTISVNSQVNQGSTFTITLPVKE